MTSEYHEQHAGGDAPPVTSGDLQPLEPPRSWPTVIGVLGIIFASLGILGGFCGMISPFSGAFFVDMVPEEQRDQMIAQMQLSNPYPLAAAGVQLVEFVLSIVLMVGSVQLLRRAQGAPGLLKGYAVADLIANFIGAGFGVVVGLSQIEKLKADPSLADVAGPMAGQTMIIFAIVMFLVAGIWPVFLLLWFGRDRIRDDIARWGESEFRGTGI